MRRSALILVAVSALVACAQRASQPVVPEADGNNPVFTQSEVEQPAKLQDCPGRLAPSVSQVYWVTFELVVDSTGHVDPLSLVHIPLVDTRRQAPDDVVELARWIALTCLYTPAHHQGKQVAVRLRQTIRLLEGP